MQTTQHRPTHPDQRRLTYGSHWMRVVDYGRSEIDFGRVATKNAIIYGATLKGWPRSRVDDELTAVRLEHLAGTLRSGVWNRLNRDGWNETVHASTVWPIPHRLYSEMAHIGWDIRGMDDRERELFSKAYGGWVSYSAGWLPERRTFEEFLAEVETVVESVTRPRPDAGYLGYNKVADRRIVLRLTDWPQAREALVALREKGFETYHTGEDALDVRDRSER